MFQSTITRRDLVVPSPLSQSGLRRLRPQQGSTFWQWLLSALPTAAVVGVLAGLAAWGHSTDWTLPKFCTCRSHGVEGRRLVQRAQRARVAVHRMQASLVPAGKNYGWCRHGVAQCHCTSPTWQKSKPSRGVGGGHGASQQALALPAPNQEQQPLQPAQRANSVRIDQVIEKAGIDVAVVEQRPVIKAVVANGEVVYDQT